MSFYNITITRPKNFVHSSAFCEVAESLAWALSALGHTATVRENWISTVEGETNILFGAELLAVGQTLPRNTILYNLEQPSHPSMPKVCDLARGLRVWDYSAVNVKEWERIGYYVKHVPIGYTPNLSRLPNPQVKDIDVLFFGWMTPRRGKIMEELKAAGLKVVFSDNCYGGGRDNLISRAKVCLNVHHDGRTMFEIVRVSYLLANGKCVVSETSSDDGEYPDLRGAFSIGDFPVDACLSLCTDGELREKFETKGFELFSKRDFIETVRQALIEITPQDRVASIYKAGCAGGDMKDFLPWLREHAKGTILEIGVRNGASTSAFLSGVEENGGVVLSLDVNDYGHLFRGHPQWKFIKASSQNEKLHFPELDVVLIDGDHTQEGYRADLQKFWPLVTKGGTILSHDINLPNGQSREDVPVSDLPSRKIREEYFNFCAEHENEIEHQELPGTYGMGVIKKLVYDRELALPL